MNYVRYSSDSQREKSIEGQLRECREYTGRDHIFFKSIWIGSKMRTDRFVSTFFRMCK